MLLKYSEYLTATLPGTVVLFHIVVGFFMSLVERHTDRIKQVVTVMLPSTRQRYSIRIFNPPIRLGTIATAANQKYAFNSSTFFDISPRRLWCRWCSLFSFAIWGRRRTFYHKYTIGFIFASNRRSLDDSKCPTVERVVPSFSNSCHRRGEI